jgi:hypothetical protein
VLSMSPQHVEVTRRQLRQLQKGALSSWTTVFHEILIREFESGVPVEFVMVDKERVLNVEPIDLRTSPAFGSGGRVDSEYIRFSTLDDGGAAAEYSNLWLRQNLIGNACWFSHIIDYWRGSFNTYNRKHRNSQAYPQNLDYETVWTICFPETINLNGIQVPVRPFTIEDLQSGFTFDDMLPFFKMYGLGCVEFDSEKNILNEIKSTRSGHGIEPTLYLAKTDQHVTRLNITNKTWAPDEDEHKGLKSSLVQKAAHGLVGAKVKQPKPYTRCPKAVYEPPKETTVVLFGGENGVSLESLLTDSEYKKKKILAICSCPTTADPLDVVVSQLMAPPYNVRPSITVSAPRDEVAVLTGVKLRLKDRTIR